MFFFERKHLLGISYLQKKEGGSLSVPKKAPRTSSENLIAFFLCFNTVTSM